MAAFAEKQKEGPGNTPDPFYSFMSDELGYLPKKVVLS